jgi:hypothetical protein
VRGWQLTTCSIAWPKQLYCAIFAINEDITSYNKAAITWSINLYCPCVTAYLLRGCLCIALTWQSCNIGFQYPCSCITLKNNILDSFLLMIISNVFIISQIGIGAHLNDFLLIFNVAGRPCCGSGG